MCYNDKCGRRLYRPDSKIAGLAHEAGKACIIAVNKWDAVEKNDKTMNEYRKKLETDFSFMSYAPMVFISAKTGQRLDRLFEMIKHTANSNAMRIKTGLLKRPARSGDRQGAAAVR